MAYTYARQAAMLVVTCLCIGGPLSGRLAAQQPNNADLIELSRTLEVLAERVSPAVVQIFASGYTAGQGMVPSGTPLVTEQRGSGSGVILDPTGYIVTNAHVVAGADRVQVELPVPLEATPARRSIVRPRGTLVGAQVVGLDRETDLAVLRVHSAQALPFLTLADSDELRPGQLVMAFGSPLGLENSVSLGVVSAVARQLQPDDPMIYIQTDASINPGNSGGPLVDVMGRVVGISTFFLSRSGGDEGLGFAAPSSIVRTVYEQIRHHGLVHRGEIGVHAQTITPALATGLGLAQHWGVVLADVYPGGPADVAGLWIGDILLQVDGKMMENARQFQVNLYPRSVGDRVDIEVLRGDRRLTVSVAPVERPGDPDRFHEMVRPEEHLVPQLGILGLNLSPEIGAMLPAVRKPYGVVVAVSSEGTLALGGEPLLPGDVIHAVNGREVTGLGQLRARLDVLKSGDAVVLQVARLGQLMFLAFRLE